MEMKENNTKKRNKGNILHNSTKFLFVSVSYWTTLTNK